jgi:hypothetical protein
METNGLQFLSVKKLELSCGETNCLQFLSVKKTKRYIWSHMLTMHNPVHIWEEFGYVFGAHGLQGYKYGKLSELYIIN